MALKRKRKVAEKSPLSIAAKIHRVLGMFLIKGMETEEAQ